MPERAGGQAGGPERVVLDASAALALLRGEPAAGAVRDALAAASPAEDAVLVPEHFWLEVVNVLVRRHGWDTAGVVRAIRELDELGVTIAPSDRPLTLLALDRMVTHGLSAYDAAYLAVAEAADAVLLTLDQGLAAAAGARALLAGRSSGHRVSDARAAYRTNPDAATPVPWAAFGGYLAELRARR